MLERRTAAPHDRRKLDDRLPQILEDAGSGLRRRVRELLAELRAEWEELVHRILDIDEELLVGARGDDARRRLPREPG